MEEDIEQIYYAIVESFDDARNTNSKKEFVESMATAFSATMLRISPYFTSRDFDIAEKWTTKLRITAGEWYEDNIQRKRDQEEREARYREERELQERRWREEQRQLREDIVQLRREEEKRKQHEEEERRHREEEERKLAENEARRKAEEEAKRKAKEAEEARVQAELAAKRKYQEEANRKKLAEIYAQWKAKHDITPNTSSQHSTATSQTDLMSCYCCGSQVSKNMKFCSVCGTKLFVTCPECGTTLKAITKFCTCCGKPVSGNGTVS